MLFRRLDLLWLNHALEMDTPWRMGEVMNRLIALALMFAPLLGIAQNFETVKSYKISSASWRKFTHYVTSTTAQGEKKEWMLFTEGFELISDDGTKFFLLCDQQNSRIVRTDNVSNITDENIESYPIKSFQTCAQWSEAIVPESFDDKEKPMRLKNQLTLILSVEPKSVFRFYSGN